MHPRVSELLAALAGFAAYAPAGDPTGWVRFDWFYQRRWSLSESGMAAERSPEGDWDHLASVARPPMEAFAIDPELVIRLALADVKEAAEGR